MSQEDNAVNLFSAGPRCPLPVEPIGALIDVLNLTTPETLDTHTRISIAAYRNCKPRPHTHKVPPAPELPACLRSVRTKMCDYIVDTFMTINRYQRLVNRLKEHYAAGTFPCRIRQHQDAAIHTQRT
ncbi:hypothetical protein DSO57_1012387 [Entomophthora muscae]|uniref:Uncharacterized protein n=1 Tax=Entomophthora muscae TaxID=34485 RepID=A0ACC2UFK6_9FUNG|nr:hypothetical protein DSO57_1012387 [Entomophthora muscae]